MQKTSFEGMPLLMAIRAHHPLLLGGFGNFLINSYARMMMK